MKNFLGKGKSEKIYKKNINYFFRWLKIEKIISSYKNKIILISILNENNPKN
jgi:hypothetical protein